MPANLTPEYFKAEKAFRQAKTAEEKIAWIDVMLRVIPKHKGTEHMRGDLRQRLAKLKRQQEVQKQKKGGSFGPKIERAGAGQFVIIGSPNVGKSELFNALTGLDAKVGDYPFTTMLPQPGLVKFEDVSIQLVDGPPVTADFVESWWQDMLRAADAGLLLVDGASDDVLDQYEEPVKRLKSSRIYLVPDEPEEKEDPVGTYLRTILLVTKCDDENAAERIEMLADVVKPDGFEPIDISILSGRNVGSLPEKFYEFLRIIRAYTRTPNKKAETDGPPFTLPAGSTVEDLAKAIHKDLASSVKYARIWGTGVYDGQPVSTSHVLSDKDIVEIHTDTK